MLLGVGQRSLLVSPYQPREASPKTHFHSSLGPAGSRNRRRRRLSVNALDPKVLLLALLLCSPSQAQCKNDQLKPLTIAGK